jgi:hypothetical protein
LVLFSLFDNKLIATLIPQGDFKILHDTRRGGGFYLHFVKVEVVGYKGWTHKERGSKLYKN